jgi:SOS-response transcriptional repressor LexA
MLFDALMWIVHKEFAPIHARMSDYRESLRAWLRNLARARGVSLTELAREAGVSTTTVTRFVNSDDWKHTLGNASIAKIEQRWDTEAPKPAGLLDPTIAKFPELQGRNSPDRQLVQVTDDALNMRGYMRGDLCEIDPTIEPSRGDTVLAEIRTPARIGQRVLLTYDSPYLRGHSTDWELSRPILLDADRVRILGVVVRVLRQSKEVA